MALSFAPYTQKVCEIVEKTLDLWQTDPSLESFLERWTSTRQLFFIGVGKSHQVGNLIASFLKSVSLPSWSLHPTDMLHGDQGSIQQEDTLIYLSRSGETEELFAIREHLPDQPSFLFTEKQESTLGQSFQAHQIFPIMPIEESRALPWMPYAHSLVILGLFGCLVETWLQRQIKKDLLQNYRLNHPGGLIGSRLRSDFSLSQKKNELLS